jgi:hypothetical protein
MLIRTYLNKIRIVLVDPGTGDEKEIGSTGPSALPTPSDNDPRTGTTPCADAED